MAESWFHLGREDQASALEVAAAESGRPAHLLEKDIWVVWTLSAIYNSSLAKTLTFKGGTSLSKVYKIIDRFSEDIDLTYDIRELVPDFLPDQNPIPSTPSQAKKITKAVRDRLPDWIEQTIKPVIEAALAANSLQAELRIDGDNKDKLIVTYPAIKTGTGYAAASIQLEFGARATGEPHAVHPVACDIAPYINGIDFPSAKPLVMAVERTFWEKATAAHVYCLQGRLRGERYSRHWYDLVEIQKTEHFQKAVCDRRLAKQVAQHKSMFFAEKNVSSAKIDYFEVTTGSLQLVPEGASLTALENDYFAMLEDGLLPQERPLDFSALIDQCRAIQDKVNQEIG